MSDNKRIAALLDLSIELELLVSDLYERYTAHFTEDRDLWRQLSLEEKNHAALLKSSHNFLVVGRFPAALVMDNTEELSNISALLKSRIKNMDAGGAAVPSHQDAYHFALWLENSAAEAHYQRLMETESEDRVIQVLQRLGSDALGHASRIKALIVARGL